MNECVLCGREATLDLVDRPVDADPAVSTVVGQFCSWRCAADYCASMAEFAVRFSTKVADRHSSHKTRRSVDTTKPPEEVIDAYDAQDLSWHDAQQKPENPADQHTVPEGAWMRLA